MKTTAKGPTYCVVAEDGKGKPWRNVLTTREARAAGEMCDLLEAAGQRYRCDIITPDDAARRRAEEELQRIRNHEPDGLGALVVEEDIDLSDIPELGDEFFEKARLSTRHLDAERAVMDELKQRRR